MNNKQKFDKINEEVMDEINSMSRMSERDYEYHLCVITEEMCAKYNLGIEDWCNMTYQT